jgi:hypothetical protein
VATPTRTAHQIPGAAGPIPIEVCSTSLGVAKPSSIALVDDDSDELIARLCRELP